MTYFSKLSTLLQHSDFQTFVAAANCACKTTKPTADYDDMHFEHTQSVSVFQTQPYLMQVLLLWYQYNHI